MMNRNQFLTKLAAELSILPKEEIEAAMEFYTEFLDEVGTENEEEAIKSLGEPKKIAAQIKSDYTVRQMDNQELGEGKTNKKYLTAALGVIAGVFAAPVAIPIAIALGMVVSAIFLMLLAVAISVFVCVIAGIACSLTFIIVGIISLSTTVSASLLLIGLGLSGLAVLSIALVGIIIAIKALFKALIKEVHKTNEKRRKRRMEKEKEKLTKGGAENA